MNKGLEALKEVNKYLTKYFNMALNRPSDTEVKWAEIDTIETELKRLEETKCELQSRLVKANAELKKQDEILRIIKEKVDDMEWLRNAITMGFALEHYNEVVSYNHGEQLTQEDFNLLKEWLK